MNRLHTILAVLAAFLWGAGQAASGITGVADSDEFLGLAFGHGLAHPPGYPLYLGLLRTLVMLVGSRPELIQASSALLMAIAGGVVIAGVNRLIGKIPGWSIWIMGLGLVLNTLWWKYSLMVEVMPLSLLLFSLLCWWWFRLSTIRREIKNQEWLLLGLILGFLINQHQMMVLILPSLLFWLVTKKIALKAWVIMGVFSLIGFTLPYVGLSLTTIPESERFSWQQPESFSDWLRYISREDFAGANMEVGLIHNGYLTMPTRAGLTESIVYAGNLLVTHTPLPALFLLLLGLLKGRKLLAKDLRLSILVLTAVLTFGVVVNMSLGGHPVGSADYVRVRELAERFYLPAVLILLVWMVLGWAICWRYLKERKFLTIVMVVAVALYYGYWFKTNFDEMKRVSDRAFEERMIHQLAKQNTVHICFEDASCFSLMALRAIWPKYDGVDIFSVAPQLSADWYEKNWRSVADNGYPDNPFRILDVGFGAQRRGKIVQFYDTPDLYKRIFGETTCNGYDECEYYKLLTDVFKNPWQIAPRLSLAQFYEERGFYPLAKREIMLVLRVEPNNETGLSKLETYRDVEDLELLP